MHISLERVNQRRPHNQVKKQCCCKVLQIGEQKKNSNTKVNGKFHHISVNNLLRLLSSIHKFLYDRHK